MRDNKFIKEFKEFISRGSVLDMAVGIIIGTAFTAIVKSLVDDILMPIIGIIIGGISFKDLQITIQGFAGLNGATIKYGLFIQNIINFLLISLVIFLMIKTINSFRKKEAVKEEEAPSVPADIALLTEIRDLLKK